MSILENFPSASTSQQPIAFFFVKQKSEEPKYFLCLLDQLDL